MFADASLVKEALEKVYLIEKKIDFVINTAGILLKIPLMTMKYDDILNLIRVNYLGAINVAKESFSYLAKSHGGLFYLLPVHIHETERCIAIFIFKSCNCEFSSGFI